MVNVERAALAIHPGYLPGNFYSTWFGTPTTGSAIAAVDTLYLYPFMLWRPATIKSLHLRVVTGGAGSSAKTGIWANSPVSYRPLGAPLVADETGQATTSSNATTTADVTDTSLSPGMYWAGTKATGTLPACYSVGSTQQSMPYFAGNASAANLFIGCALSFADAYSNAMPTLAEGASFTVVTGSGTPILGFGA